MRSSYHHPLLLHHNSWGVPLSPPTSPPPASSHGSSPHSLRRDTRQTSVNVLRSVAVDLSRACPPHPTIVPLHLTSPPSRYSSHDDDEDDIPVFDDPTPSIGIFSYEYPQKRDYIQLNRASSLSIEDKITAAHQLLHRPIPRQSRERRIDLEDYRGRPKRVSSLHRSPPRHSSYNRYSSSPLVHSSNSPSSVRLNRNPPINPLSHSSRCKSPGRSSSFTYQKSSPEYQYFSLFRPPRQTRDNSSHISPRGTRFLSPGATQVQTNRHSSLKSPSVNQKNNQMPPEDIPKDTRNLRRLHSTPARYNSPATNTNVSHNSPNRFTSPHESVNITRPSPSLNKKPSANNVVRKQPTRTTHKTSSEDTPKRPLLASQETNESHDTPERRQAPSLNHVSHTVGMPLLQHGSTDYYNSDERLRMEPEPGLCKCCETKISLCPCFPCCDAYCPEGRMNNICAFFLCSGVILFIVFSPLFHYLVPP